MTHAYPYSEGNRLLERNDYAFSPWGGQNFIDAWRTTREQAAALLGSPVSAIRADLGMDVCAEGRAHGTSLALMERLASGWAAGHPTDGQVQETFALVRRFELSRRVYRDYDLHFRPIDARDFLEIAPYVVFAELLAQAWQYKADLRIANALLKCCDILVAMRRELPPAMHGRVLRVLACEVAMVDAIIARAGRLP